MDNGLSTNYYYHYDALGSVTEITDSTGALIERYTYDIYGSVIIKDANGEVLSQSAINNRYTFTGRELDQETGLYYYRARYYDPTIGRFLQTDPIGYEGGINLYTYVKNNPINYTDPLGLCEAIHDACGNIIGWRYCGDDPPPPPDDDPWFREKVKCYLKCAYKTCRESLNVWLCLWCFIQCDIEHAQPAY